MANLGLLTKNRTAPHFNIGGNETPKSLHFAQEHLNVISGLTKKGLSLTPHCNTGLKSQWKRPKGKRMFRAHSSTSIQMTAATEGLVE